MNLYVLFAIFWFIFYLHLFLFLFFHIDIVYECIVLRCIVKNILTYSYSKLVQFDLILDKSVSH